MEESASTQAQSDGKPPNLTGATARRVYSAARAQSRAWGVVEVAYGVHFGPVVSPGEVGQSQETRPQIPR